MAQIKKEEKKLIIGTRNFRKLENNQSGLRAFPSKLIPDLIHVEGERYEYERNVLLFCIQENIPIIEVPL